MYNTWGIQLDFFFNLIFKIIYFWFLWIFIVALGLFSSCGELGPLFIAKHGLLISVAPLAAEHRPQGTWASVVAAHGLRSCGSKVLECELRSCGAHA